MQPIDELENDDNQHATIIQVRKGLEVSVQVMFTDISKYKKAFRLMRPVFLGSWEGFMWIVSENVQPIESQERWFIPDKEELLLVMAYEWTIYHQMWKIESVTLIPPPTPEPPIPRGPRTFHRFDTNASKKGSVAIAASIDNVWIIRGVKVSDNPLYWIRNRGRRQAGKIPVRKGSIPAFDSLRAKKVSGTNSFWPGGDLTPNLVPQRTRPTVTLFLVGGAHPMVTDSTVCG